MRIEHTPLNGLLLIEPVVFSDQRGHFFESYNQERFREATGSSHLWVQDNESLSAKGVIRGLHFQSPPFAQAKLVRVSHGSVFDVVVDLRKESITYGHSFGVVLSAGNKLQLLIPEGFAHGFQVLEDHTVFSYKCSAPYSKDHEHCLLWNDPKLNIQWPILDPILSEKDAQAMVFSEFKSPF